MDKPSRKMPIHCHPFEYESGNHIVHKAGRDGVKHYYLRGISSGIRTDGTGERMTENCIKSMEEQAKSGNVCLFEGQHGVNGSDDLGILTDSDITDKGDWITTYRIYDDSDTNLSDTNKQKGKHLVAQLMGMPPYKKPLQRGFSIEGVVPEHEILSKTVEADGSYRNRVINFIQLDGVLVVPRPAYQDSVVTAVYKCLGELPPVVTEKLQTVYKDCFGLIQNNHEDFYKKFFEAQDLLYDKINEIMRINDSRKAERLDVLFNVHKSALKGVILQNEGIFKSGSTDASGYTLQDDNSIKLYEMKKNLYKQLSTLSLLIRQKLYSGGIKPHGNKNQISKQKQSSQ